MAPRNCQASRLCRSTTGPMSGATTWPSSTTTRPWTTVKRARVGAQKTVAATGSWSAPAYSTAPRSSEKKSAHFPVSREPTSSRPRTRAPRASRSRAPRARSSTAGPGRRRPRRPSIGHPSTAPRRRPRSRRASSIAWRVSRSRFEESLLAEPSTPRPTPTPAARYFLTGRCPRPAACSRSGNGRRRSPPRRSGRPPRSLTWTA